MPLLILAGALKAVEAIQQGCELYKEYKGTVLKAKATFDEVKGIATEVTQVSTGVWGFIKDKLFPSEEPSKPVVPETTITASSAENTSSNRRKQVPLVEQYDEQIIKNELIKNLKKFFKAMIAINKKIEAQQLRIDTEEIDPDELLDVSLDLVVAKKEMEKAQKEIREVMVYQSPPELGALYSDVIEMFGIVKEKQEITHLLTKKRKKDEILKKNRLMTKFRKRIAWVVVMALIVLETWGLIAAILLARQPT
jgi:hypothetical protein